MNAPDDPTWQRTRALGTETWQLTGTSGIVLAQISSTKEGWWNSSTYRTSFLGGQVHHSRDDAMLTCEIALKVLRGRVKPPAT